MAINDDLNISNVIKVLEDYGSEFESLYKNKLNNDNRKASGNLINSITTAIKIHDDYVELTFSAADYWKYVEYGRKAGKRPPLEKILSWIKAKKILPRPDSSGRLPTEKQLAFLIARAIGNNGTIKDKGYQGGNYVADTIEELNQKYMPLLENALSEDYHRYEILIMETINKMKIY